MAKYANVKKYMLVGIEKFKLYAEPRGIKMNLDSYGVYKIVHKGKNSALEAVRASKNINGETVTGWVINIAGRQRTFKADGSGYEVYPLKK